MLLAFIASQVNNIHDWLVGRLTLVVTNLTGKEPIPHLKAFVKFDIELSFFV